MARMRRLLDPGVSLDRAYAVLHDPNNSPTPQVVIEAVIYDVLENGIGALENETDQQRLRLCDQRAMEELRQRLASLGDGA
jgi:hypothetical protein